MIAKILKHSTFFNAINYQEKKCQKGVGELIEKNAIGNNTNQLDEYMKSIMESNTGVYKNACHHIAISFHPSENISNEQAIEILSDFLNHKKTGYSNNSYLIYRNYDEPHPHFHIITPSIDNEGKKIAEWNDQHRFNDVCSEIEYSRNLYKTNHRSSETSITRKHSEINQERFSISNQLDYLATISNTLSPELKQIDYLALKQSTNSEIKTIIGKSNYNKIVDHLLQEKKILPTKKKMLTDKLEYIRSISKDSDQFQKLLEKNNIKFNIYTSKDGNYLTYTDLTSGFNIKENKLGSKYSYHNIIKNELSEHVTKNFTDVEVKNFLKNKIFNQLKRSTSYEQLKANLSSSGIFILENKTQGTIKGISFFQEGTQPIKGSEIHKHLSFKNIESALAKNEKYKTENSITPELKISTPKQTNPEPEINSQNISPIQLIKSLAGSSPLSDDEDKRKRRKKRDDEDQDKEHQI